MNHFATNWRMVQRSPIGSNFYEFVYSATQLNFDFQHSCSNFHKLVHSATQLSFDIGSNFHALAQSATQPIFHIMRSLSLHHEIKDV